MRSLQSLLIGIVFAACTAVPHEEGFLVHPLQDLASFERTNAPGFLDVLLQPDFSVPDHLRPCCAFGHDMDVRVGALPIPAVQVRNVVHPAELGHHSYNGGLVSPRHGVREGFISEEKNGLVYTCRGGFIDIAHVRDYADWTVFLARRIETMLDTGGAMELSEEGARRFVFVTAIDPSLISRIGRRALSVQLAEWLAFQLSVWHETATWYGWSSLPLFPELASAFSPEDFYSNLLGIRIASYVIQAGGDASEAEFNRALDAAIADGLARLGAAPPEVTRRALDAVDGLWWNSKERLPNARVVLRRNFSMGPEISPWRIPADRVTAQLAEDHEAICPELPDSPAMLSYPTGIEELDFDRMAKLDIRVGEEFASKLPLPDPSLLWLSQSDFPGIVDRARAENERVFGPGTDRPGIAGEARR